MKKDPIKEFLGQRVLILLLLLSVALCVVFFRMKGENPARNEELVRQLQENSSKWEVVVKQ